MSPRNPRRTPFERLPKISAVLIVLISAQLSALAIWNIGCAPVVNDWSNHTSLPKSRYQSGLAAGNSALDLLGGTAFSKLVVEIQSVRGFAPTQAALTHFQRFLEERLNKPGGVSFDVSDTLPSIVDGAKAAGYSNTDVLRIEHRNRRIYSSKDEFAVYFLFLDSAAAQDLTGGTKTLGAPESNTSAVIFENTIRQAVSANPNAPLWMVEATVLEQHFGRLLGLVANPTPAFTHHEDPNHPGYCSQEGCLMNFAFTFTSWITAPSGPPGGWTPPALDTACLQDLKTAGGK